MSTLLPLTLIQDAVQLEFEKLLEEHRASKAASKAPRCNGAAAREPSPEI